MSQRAPRSVMTMSGADLRVSQTLSVPRATRRRRVVDLAPGSVGVPARPAAGGQVGSRPKRPVAKIDLIRTAPPGRSSHANCSAPLELAPTSGFAVSRELLHRAQSAADLHEPVSAPARRCHRSTCTGGHHAGRSGRVGCGSGRRGDRPAPGCHGNLHGATPCSSAARRPARTCQRSVPRPQPGGRGGRLDLAVCQGAILRCAVSLGGVR